MRCRYDRNYIHLEDLFIGRNVSKLQTLKSSVLEVENLRDPLSASETPPLTTFPFESLGGFSVNKEGDPTKHTKSSIEVVT